MSRALAIARREYASLFAVPVGWIVLALFLFLSGIIFTSRILVPGEPASLRAFFGVWWTLILVLAPAVSMRLIADEIRTGTIETLLTSPASEWAVVLGKYAAAAGFLLTMLAPTLAYPAILFSVSDPDPGPIVAGYLGIVLLGCLYLAIGTLASSLTSSQTLAFLGTLFIPLVVEVILRPIVAPMLPSPFDRAVYALSADARLTDFARGIIDLEHVMFFISASAFFLVLAVISLQLRRWR